jgi:hypothetical protein
MREQMSRREQTSTSKPQDWGRRAYPESKKGGSAMSRMMAAAPTADEYAAQVRHDVDFALARIARGEGTPSYTNLHGAAEAALFVYMFTPTQANLAAVYAAVDAQISG